MTAGAAAPAARSLSAVWLGRRRYAPVHELMEQAHAARRAGRGGDTVLFVEHEPVITLGRGSKDEHVLAPSSVLVELGVDTARVGRGGDVTLHAPGQLVGYPIVDLSPDRRDVRRFVTDLTETMRRLTTELGVEAGRHPDHVGLWADAASPSRFAGAADARELVKIGAVGVRISRWVTMHGFALNLAPDLAFYRLIVPCGIRTHAVSSIAALGGQLVDVGAAARRAFEILADVLGARRERFTVLE